MGFWQIIGAGWRGALGAVKANIGLFLVAALVAVLANGAVDFIFQSMLPIPSRRSFEVIHSFWPVIMVVNLFETVVIACVVTPCMIAVHRSILCGERHVAFSSLNRLGLFGSLLFFVQIIEGASGMAGPWFLPGLVGEVQAVLGWISFTFVILFVRFVLAFPAIALDIAKPIHVSWTCTRGHWWYIAGIFICGTLPIFLGAIILGILSIFIPIHLRVYPFEYNVLSGLLVIFFPTLGAGFASELYRKFGGVIEPAMSVPEPYPERL